MLYYSHLTGLTLSMRSHCDRNEFPRWQNQSSHDFFHCPPKVVIMNGTNVSYESDDSNRGRIWSDSQFPFFKNLQNLDSKSAHFIPLIFVNSFLQLFFNFTTLVPRDTISKNGNFDVSCVFCSFDPPCHNFCKRRRLRYSFAESKRPRGKIRSYLSFVFFGEKKENENDFEIRQIRRFDGLRFPVKFWDILKTCKKAKIQISKFFFDFAHPFLSWFPLSASRIFNLELFLPKCRFWCQPRIHFKFHSLKRANPSHFLETR